MSVRAGLEAGCTEEESRSMRKQALRTLLGDVLTATIVNVRLQPASAMPVCTVTVRLLFSVAIACNVIALVCCDHTVGMHKYQLMSPNLKYIMMTALMIQQAPSGAMTQ